MLNDYWDGNTKHQAPFAININKKLPELSTPYKTQNFIFHSYCPRFLTNFSDEEYCQVYQNLHANHDAECPTW